MTTYDTTVQSRLEVVWALVLIQGGIVALLALESLVFSAVSGFVTMPLVIVNVSAAVLALFAARGLRRRRRWARRVTLFAEWFVLLVGTLEVLATMFLTTGPPALVPLITGVLVPVVVLVLLRGTKPIFAASERIEEAPEPLPADDPIVGTLV